jgi:hypothetical protein
LGDTRDMRGPTSAKGTTRTPTVTKRAAVPAPRWVRARRPRWFEQVCQSSGVTGSTAVVDAVDTTAAAADRRRDQMTRATPTATAFEVVGLAAEVGVLPVPPVPPLPPAGQRQAPTPLVHYPPRFHRR